MLSRDKIKFLAQCLLVVWTGLGLSILSVVAGMYVYIHMLGFSVLGFQDLLDIGLRQ